MQNIYSIIRTLDALESEYSRGKVKGDEYNHLCQELIGQYKATIENLENYIGLDFFVERYNLKHCKNAINRLKDQRSNLQISSEQMRLITVTSKFSTEIVELQDMIEMGDIQV